VRLLALLDAVGFPNDLHTPLEGSPLYPDYVEAVFSLLGSAPGIPKAPGALLAVVAPTGSALPIARAIAKRNRLNPIHVALIAPPSSPTASLPAPSLRQGRTTLGPRPAAGFVATDLAAIRALSPGWRRDRTGIVAIEIDERRGGALTRAALRALAPSAVWLYADARTKSEDITARIASIGGADALMLDHIGETSTPASALRAGVPVAMIDGLPASVSRWLKAVHRATGEA
jgi:hypothetical protein